MRNTVLPLWLLHKAVLPLPILQRERTPHRPSLAHLSRSTRSPVRDVSQPVSVYQIPHSKSLLVLTYLSDPQVAQTLPKPNKSRSPLSLLPEPGPRPIFPFNKEHHHPIQSPKPQTLASSSMPPHLSNYQVLDHLPPPQGYLPRPTSLVSVEAHLSPRA